MPSSAGPRGAGPSRPLAGLIAAVAIEWTGATSVLPFLPLYLRDSGASYALVGLVMGAFLLASFVVQYPLGRLSDRIGRRRLVIAGLLLYAAATLGFLLPIPPLAFILLRAAQGAGAGAVQVTSQALVADLVPPARQGRAYGLLNGAQMTGMVVGPVIGSILFALAPPAIFVSSALGSLGAAAAVVALVPRRPRPGPLPGPGGRLAANPVVVGVLLASAAIGLLVGMYEADWSLLMRAKGATSWEVGLSFTLFALPLVLLSWPGGWLADHWDRRWLGGLSVLVDAGCAALYPALPSPPALMALGCVEAASVAVGFPALLSLLMQAAGPGAAGRAQGAAGSAQTGASAVGAVVAGALFAYGIWEPFVGVAVVATLMALCLPVLWRAAPLGVVPST